MSNFQQFLTLLDEIFFPNSCIACRNRFISEETASIISTLLDEVNIYYYLLAERLIDLLDSEHEVLFYTRKYETLLRDLSSCDDICYKCFRQINFRSISNLRIFIPLQINTKFEENEKFGDDLVSKREDNFLAVISSCDYGYPISTLVRLLKFNNATYVLNFVAKLYYLAYLRYILAMYYQQIKVSPYDICEFDACVALPLHKKRLKERSYNQAELIVEELNKYLRLRNLSGHIHRVKYTKRQSEMEGAKGRRENLLNVFECDSEVFLNKKVLLLDDVMTSGASLTEACKALYSAGAKLVVAIVLATNKGAYHYFEQN